MPILFNSLCPLLRYEIPNDDSEPDLKILQQYDSLCGEVANTVSAIASYGIQDIKDQEGKFLKQSYNSIASLEDKMIYGNETSPMQRLY